MYIARKLWYVPLVMMTVLVIALMLGERKTAVEAMEPTEPVLIIDPGHGGADGGAVAQNGTLEADINLDIALRVEALSSFFGTKCEMTRRTAEIDYPAEADTVAKMKVADQRERLSFIHGIPGGVLLSIHQNYYPADGPNGPQVFYGKEAGSELFAARMQNGLTSFLSPENRRLAAPASEDIYLMKNADCPAVLVECGFLSNSAERGRLETDSYRLQLAAVMFGTYLQYIRGFEV